MAAALRVKGPSARTVALPAEHGGWGLLAEPLLLGMLLAPSAGGAGVAVATVAAFLCRHPLKLALSDWRRKARTPRTALAVRWAALYAVLALLGLALAGWKAGLVPLAPLAAAAPLALVQLAYDMRLEGRRLAPELLGGVALGSAAASIMLAGNWSWTTAAAVWALLAAKAVSSVLYIRTRFRLDRGQDPSLWPASLSHAAGVATALGLGILGWAPWVAVLAFAALLVRALYGLSPFHRKLRPQAVGVQEVAFGSLTVLLLVLGYALEP